MRPCFLALASLALSAVTVFSQERSREGISLINNQPFPIRMPVTLKNAAGLVPATTEMVMPIQPDGSNLVFVASVEAKSQKQIVLSKGAPRPIVPLLLATPAPNGVKLEYRETDLGVLTWGLVLQKLKKQSHNAEGNERPIDFDAAFEPLTLEFRKTNSGPVFTDWFAMTGKDGLKLGVILRVFHEGFIELRTRLINENSTETSNVYAAVVCRWDQPNMNSRSLCYDNHISVLGDNSHSSFRDGEGRHLFLQHGVDWLRTQFYGNLSAAWLNDFSPSFTVEVPATPKTPAHYTGANLSQLGQEAQAKGNRLYSITEIARGNIRSYRDRVKENILPPQGEGVSFRSLLILGSDQLNDQQTDNAFVGFAGYNEQVIQGRVATMSFGTRAVRFGTSYFPYSTLGENFDSVKLPGMDRESFWPLAADTVNQWRLFQDDIRRDLRIAKTMGFQLIRLHHLELLAAIDQKVRQDYLDFLFGELRHLGLKALIDIYASPRQISEMLTRYGDVVDGLEIENEILIWGIPIDRPQYWNEVYEAVKQTAPHVKVNLTGYNNTGMFDRLKALGVNYDRVCLHSYLDTVDAIPSARGYALALSSYATKAGKSPMISEWNWRGLTKLTEEARARIYPQIIEGAVGTRGIPDFYQFQFNETLCPNPRSGRGNILRHYELLHLSRRPKLEALALVDLIKKYSAPEDSLRWLSFSAPPVVLDAKGRAKAKVAILNTSQLEQSLWITAESPESLLCNLKGRQILKLGPGQEKTVTLDLEAPDRPPGFYYCFLRVEGAGGLLRYAEVEASLRGKPQFDGEEPRVDWLKPIKVVYGQDAPVLEVETAIAIAETLESATGSPVEVLKSNDLLPSSAETDLQILVGSADSNKKVPLIPIPGDGSTNGFVGIIGELPGNAALVITGKDSREVENAGMGFLLSYWTHAKDSAARRVGLVAKQLPRGVDATKLP